MGEFQSDAIHHQATGALIWYTVLCQLFIEAYRAEGTALTESKHKLKLALAHLAPCTRLRILMEVNKDAKLGNVCGSSCVRAVASTHSYSMPNHFVSAQADPSIPNIE